MTPIPVGTSTKAGIAGAIAYALGGVMNLLAGGPIEATVAGLTASFGCIATVMVGRYAQAVKVPHTIQNLAKIADMVLEHKLHLETVAKRDTSEIIAKAAPVEPVMGGTMTSGGTQTTHAHAPAAVHHEPAAAPHKTTVTDKISEAAAEAKRRLGH
jgi:hypothetical protein